MHDSVNVFILYIVVLVIPTNHLVGGHQHFVDDAFGLEQAESLDGVLLAPFHG